MANDVQTNIRLPADLKEALADAAQKSGRSFTAEVVLRLQQSMALSALEDPANLERLEKRVELAARLEDALRSIDTTREELNAAVATTQSNMETVEEMRLELAAKMREVDAALKRAKAK